MAATVSRADLAGLCKGNPKLIAYFEEQQRIVASTEEQTAQNVAATQGLANATFVLLSADDSTPGARILAVGSGLAIRDNGPGGTLVIGLTHSLTFNGPYPVTFNLVADTNLDLPPQGRVLVDEDFAGGPYADDAAAAADGVPVGGIYRQPLGVVAWRQE